MDYSNAGVNYVDTIGIMAQKKKNKNQYYNNI